VRSVRHISVLRLTSAIGDLHQIYPWLEQATADGGIVGDRMARMQVALEEAVTNVARHGFDPGAVGMITVRLRHEPDAVVLEVEDNGVRYDPTAAPIPRRPKHLSDAVPGSWGLGLIRRFCPSIAYERRGEKNHLTMRFPAAG
jgi:serine/threonine-protein kinase RsbW